MITKLKAEQALFLLFKTGKGLGNTKEPYIMENIDYIRIAEGMLIIKYKLSYTDENGDYFLHIGRYNLEDIARWWIDNLEANECIA